MRDELSGFLPSKACAYLHAWRPGGGRGSAAPSIWGVEGQSLGQGRGGRAVARRLEVVGGDVQAFDGGHERERRCWGRDAARDSAV